MLSWMKSQNIQYSPFFNLKEFACKCTRPECVMQTLSIDLLKKLEQVRKAYGKPIQITSGYRCQAHQKYLAESGLETATNSQHCLGRASDITGADLDVLDGLCSHEFKATGRARSFIHVDLRDDKIRRWGYLKT